MEGAAFVDMGDQFIALMEGRRQAADDERHFGLVVDDVAAVRAAVEREGLEIVNPARARARLPRSLGQSLPGRGLRRDPVRAHSRRQAQARHRGPRQVGRGAARDRRARPPLTAPAPAARAVRSPDAADRHRQDLPDGNRAARVQRARDGGRDAARARQARRRQLPQLLHGRVEPDRGRGPGGRRPRARRPGRGCGRPRCCAEPQRSTSGSRASCSRCCWQASRASSSPPCPGTTSSCTT